MFIHSHLSSSLLCEVAISTVRMLPLEYALVTATMAFPMTWIITGNAVKQFFSRKRKQQKKHTNMEVLLKF